MLKHDIDFVVPPTLDGQTTACLRLWAEVFRLGIEEEVARMRDRKPVVWIDRPEGGIGSFVWLCDLFDLEPDVVLRLVRRRGRNADR